MKMFSTVLIVAAAMLLILPAAAWPDDVTITLDTGSNFVVKDDQSTERFRVEASTGIVHIEDAVIGNAEIASLGAPSNQGDIYYHDGTSIMPLPPGTAGQVLQTSGVSADPVWAPAPINATQTYHYGVPGPSFRPFFGSQTHDTSNFGYWRGNGSTSTKLQVIAPLHLPDGATVTALDCYYYDSSGTVSMDLNYIFGRRSWQGDPSPLVSLLAVTSGSLNAIVKITETDTGDSVINN